MKRISERSITNAAALTKLNGKWLDLIRQKRIHGADVRAMQKHHTFFKAQQDELVTKLQHITQIMADPASQSDQQSILRVSQSARLSELRMSQLDNAQSLAAAQVEVTQHNAVVQQCDLETQKILKLYQEALRRGDSERKKAQQAMISTQNHMAIATRLGLESSQVRG